MKKPPKEIYAVIASDGIVLDANARRAVSDAHAARLDEYQQSIASEPHQVVRYVLPPAKRKR